MDEQTKEQIKELADELDFKNKLEVYMFIGRLLYETDLSQYEIADLTNTTNVIVSKINVGDVSRMYSRHIFNIAGRFPIRLIGYSKEEEEAFMSDLQMLKAKYLKAWNLAEFERARIEKAEKLKEKFGKKEVNKKEDKSSKPVKEKKEVKKDAKTTTKSKKRDTDGAYTKSRRDTRRKVQSETESLNTDVQTNES